MDVALGGQGSLRAASAPLRLLLVCEESFLSTALAASLERDPSGVAVTCINAAAIAPGLADQADVLLVYAEHPQDIALVRRLREMAPRCPIVGCGMAESRENFIAWVSAGAAGYIPKSTHLRQFLPRLRNILDLWTRAIGAPLQPASWWRERAFRTSRVSEG